jgi:hypothetical protein
VEIYKRMAGQHALHRVVDRLVVNDPGILEDATGMARRCMYPVAKPNRHRLVCCSSSAKATDWIISIRAASVMSA